MRGGKRQGAGAKPGTAKFTARLDILVTPAQLATVKANGGGKWVRALIEANQGSVDSPRLGDPG